MILDYLKNFLRMNNLEKREEKLLQNRFILPLLKELQISMPDTSCSGVDYTDTIHWFSALKDQATHDLNVCLATDANELKQEPIVAFLRKMSQYANSTIQIVLDSRLSIEENQKLLEIKKNIENNSQQSSIAWHKSRERIQNHFSIVTDKIAKQSILYSERAHKDDLPVEERKGFVSYGKDEMIPVGIKEFERLETCSDPV